MTEQLIVNMQYDSASNKNLARFIQINSLKLLHIIDCSLDVSLLQQGQFKSIQSVANISQVMNDIILDFSSEL